MSFAVRGISQGLKQKVLGAAPAQVVGRRFMSGGSDKSHDIEETIKWRNITAVAYVGCIAMGIYTFVGGSEHGHGHHEKPPYPYLHIRNKEFPWGPCGLFEWDCKAHE